MILVDTSVWVEFFQHKNKYLRNLLKKKSVVIHPLIIGELACGNFSNRQEILYHLHSLPKVIVMEDDEVLNFIEKYKLYGKGIGWIDFHILLSSLTDKYEFFTLDKKLNKIYKMKI